MSPHKSMYVHTNGPEFVFELSSTSALLTLSSLTIAVCACSLFASRPSLASSSQALKSCGTVVNHDLPTRYLSAGHLGIGETTGKQRPAYNWQCSLKSSKSRSSTILVTLLSNSSFSTGLERPRGSDVKVGPRLRTVRHRDNSGKQYSSINSRRL